MGLNTIVLTLTFKSNGICHATKNIVIVSYNNPNVCEMLNITGYCGMQNSVKDLAQRYDERR